MNTWALASADALGLRGIENQVGSLRLTTSGEKSNEEAGDSQQWTQLFDQVASFRELSDNWDGMEAVAPPAEVVESTLELMRLLRLRGWACPTGAAPGSNGSVLLHWESSQRNYLEVDVTKPWHAEWMLSAPNQPAKHWVTATTPVKRTA